MGMVPVKEGTEIYRCSEEEAGQINAAIWQVQGVPYARLTCKLTWDPTVPFDKFANIWLDENGEERERKYQDDSEAAG
jgi:beta-glucanase (GH16 family)